MDADSNGCRLYYYNLKPKVPFGFGGWGLNSRNGKSMPITLRMFMFNFYWIGLQLWVHVCIIKWSMNFSKYLDFFLNFYTNMGNC